VLDSSSSTSILMDADQCRFEHVVRNQNQFSGNNNRGASGFFSNQNQGGFGAAQAPATNETNAATMP